MALCTAGDGYGLAVYYEEGWLSFVESVVAWSPTNALPVVGLYCPRKQTYVMPCGLTEDEYWHFVELTEAYNGKRSKEYDLMPDIRNEPVSITTVLVNLAIGVALTAISALLAPKPQAPNSKSKRRSSATCRPRVLPVSSALPRPITSTASRSWRVLARHSTGLCPQRGRGQHQAVVFADRELWKVSAPIRDRRAQP